MTFQWTHTASLVGPKRLHKTDQNKTENSKDSNNVVLLLVGLINCLRLISQREKKIKRMNTEGTPLSYDLDITLPTLLQDCPLHTTSLTKHGGDPPILTN